MQSTKPIAAALHRRKRLKRRSPNSTAHEDRTLEPRLAGSANACCGRAARYGPEVAETVGERLRYLVDQIGHEPESAPRIEGRPGVHVIPLIKYPYKIFYRITENAVRILHIRHTSGRPW